MVVARGRVRSHCLMGTGFILGDENILEVVVMFVQLCECSKTH